MKDDIGVIKFILNKYKNQKFKIFLTIILLALLTAQELYIPVLTRKIIDDAIIKKNVEFLFRYSLAYMLLQCFSSFLDTLLRYIYSEMKNKISAIIRCRILTKLSKLSGVFYSNKDTGDILSIFQSDVESMEKLDIDAVSSVVKSIIMIFVSIYMLIKIHARMFMVAIVFQIVLNFAQRLFSRCIYSNVLKTRSAYSRVMGIAQEYISNIMNIILSGSSKYFIERYINFEEIRKRLFISTDLVYSLNVSFATIVNALLTGFIYCYGGISIIKGRLSIGSLFAFQVYCSMMVGSFMSIVAINSNFQKAKVSVSKIDSFLKREDISEDDKYKITINDRINTIELKNITFNYGDNSNQKALNEVSAKFESGKIFGIVGSSGSGKSTLTKLIYKLWDDYEGEIFINGSNIKDISTYSIREKVAVVCQDGIVFDSTIRENICMGRDISEQNFNVICSLLDIFDITEGLEHGLDSNIGEDGVKLSGGQKQKISLARALLGNEDVIIFDEATSSLDNSSQKKIVEVINGFSKNKIIVLIAHRLSIVKNVDKIYVFDNGEIVEVGTHSDLIENRKKYYELYNDN